MKLIHIIAAIFFLSLCTLNVQAQSVTNNQTQGVNYSLVPVMGYSSDFGFFGGGLFQRVDYSDGVSPFLSRTIADLTGSTNGKWAAAVEYERTRAFGRPIRTRSILTAERNPVSNFFGIGNDTGFSTDRFDEGGFFLLQKRINARFEIRRPLHTLRENGDIEGVLRVRMSYTENSDQGSDTRFFNSPPPGAEGGWVNTVGAGIIYDIRNNEFDPRAGARAELGVDISPEPLGNDFGFTTYFAEMSFYLPMIENTIFAQRIAVEHSSGDVPYFELPALGHSNGLRGYALNRFLGESSVVYMAEARSWLFHFFDDQIRLGGHAFFDTGRVFSGADSNGFFQEWKRTWGVGGAMSAFNPDLIFRGEIGFSDETYRIYAGVGFAF